MEPTLPRHVSRAPTWPTLTNLATAFHVASAVPFRSGQGDRPGFRISHGSLVCRRLKCAPCNWHHWQIDSRLEERTLKLTNAFAVSVYAYPAISNHVDLLVQLDPGLVEPGAIWRCRPTTARSAASAPVHAAAVSDQPGPRLDGITVCSIKPPLLA